MKRIVTLFEEEDFDFPETLDETIRWLTEILNKAPQEERGAAKISVESEWESSGVNVEVYFYRDETEEDLAEDKRRASEFNEVRKEREIRQLRALQSKYKDEL